VHSDLGHALEEQYRLKTVIVVDNDQFNGDEVPRRIGVAAGLATMQAIEGALRCGFINILVTDSAVAQALYDRHHAGKLLVHYLHNERIRTRLE
jgi:DNA-binding transcriptional regulator LsrR (DeoR family)